ncbi:MAG: galactose mutarotase [Hyphomicrobiales bacterium]|jgi:aldose 1-epimerase|nr:galactose mutarotase [Hyphomicrobiales bacterium]
MLELKSKGHRAIFSRLGAKLVSFYTDGIDVVAGPGSDADALASDWFSGAVTGRYAGRITKARFMLDGEEVRLVPNVGEDQLHGGPQDFCNAMWKSAYIDNGIRFTLHSPDGDQGFPGAMEVSATYRLIDNVLSLDLGATTTKPTVVNLTNHAYWNLAGSGSGLDQEVEMPADHYLPLQGPKLPTGEIRDVTGTVFDFRKLRKVGQAYDACFCLNGKRGQLRKGLTLRDPDSGRTMEVYTTECAIQFYTADHFGPKLPGKYGPLVQHGSIAIEPQNYPDAPNHANFPSSILRPGEVYHHRIEWRFP